MEREIQKKRGSTLVYWIAMLLVIMCLGMGVGCDDLGNALSVQVGTECHNDNICATSGQSRELICVGDPEHPPPGGLERSCHLRKFFPFIILQRETECSNCEEPDCQICTKVNP